MRSLFPGSYPPSDDEFKLMWAEGMFVFDTSMLLNFYRYSEETRREFLDIVSVPEMAPRVWIPHRVAEEYHRNLDEVRYEQVGACVKMRTAIAEWAKSLRAGDHKKRADQLLGLADKLVSDADEQYRHPDRQALIGRIAQLFEGKVGPEWDEKRLADLYKDGERRYKSNVPPGFKDKPKQDNEQYGDLIIWFQMIEEAEKRKKPVVFVTDDLKEDWWLRVGGKTVGPLPALCNEMRRKASVQFYMYPGDRFLEQARISLKSPVREETVAEVKQVREEQQVQLRAVDELAMERDQVRRELVALTVQLQAIDLQPSPNEGKSRMAQKAMQFKRSRLAMASRQLEERLRALEAELEAVATYRRRLFATGPTF